MNAVYHKIYDSLSDLYPQAEARSLALQVCRDLLGMGTAELYAGKDTDLSPSKCEDLENIISRLRRFEPIQYIRGTADFFDWELEVAPGVLIPRPETRELVEAVCKYCPQAATLLDVGTGSGCIAIALAKLLPGSRVTGWDVSEEALAVARRNNDRLQANVLFRRQDIFGDIPSADEPFDVIVSNPPYVTESEKAEMERNVLDWEPAQALFVPDDDPLRFYRRIAEIGHSLLKEGGSLFFEVNRAYADETAGLLVSLGYGDPEVIKDFYGNQRIVKVRK